MLYIVSSEATYDILLTIDMSKKKTTQNFISLSPFHGPEVRSIYVLKKSDVQ